MKSVWCMVYEVCSPHGDEGLESSFDCNIFGIKLYEDEYGEHEEDMYNEEYDEIMKTPPYLTKMWMMTIEHTLKTPFLMYQEKGVLI